MKYFLVLIFSFLIFSCTQESNTNSVFKTNNFVLVDSAISPSKFLELGEEGGYPIYYAGELKDTIKIGKQYRIGRTIWTDYQMLPVDYNYSIKKLELFVDTAVQVNSPSEYHSADLDIAEYSTENYHSYLLTVRNISDSALYLGSTFWLYYVNREAKDRNGNWIKIDKKLYEMSICGTGQPTIILKKNEIIISKVKRYSGNFLTDFRVVYGFGNRKVYSNVYKDFIDERTFE